MTVARTVLHSEAATQAGRRCESREGAGVNVEGGDGGHLRGSVGGGRWGGFAPAAVSHRNDASVVGEEVVDRVVEVEVAR